MRILLLNGPNLNLLGTRAPEVYGAATLEEVEGRCLAWAAEYGHRLEAFQSNHEGALIDALHAARGAADAVVFNPGAYTHTSYALRDAIEAVELPVVEVHISNVEEREAWRRVSLIEPVCAYRIFGRGLDGYRAAIARLHHQAVHPPITLPYGGLPDQEGDLRLPEGPGPHPAAVLFHGGGWTRPYTRDTLDGAAVDLAARGAAAWNVEYRRIPPEGGWREMLEDAASAVDALDRLAEEHPIDLGRVTVFGHSAGGHMAFFAAKNARRRPVRLVTAGGMLDLRRLGPNYDRLLARSMGGELETRLDSVDPIRCLPAGAPVVAVHGGRDEDIPPSQSRRFVEAALAAGGEAKLAELPEAGHLDVIDPRSPFWEASAAACLGEA